MIRKNLLVIPGLIIFLLFGSQTGFANLTTTDYTLAQTISTPSFWRTELYFGRDKNDGTQVSDEEWSKFLDELVTPKFPDGLTVLDGSGQYRLENGSIVKEKSKVLILLYTAKTRLVKSRKIDQIRSAYKKMFKQESVLRIDFLQTVKVSF